MSTKLFNRLIEWLATCPESQLSEDYRFRCEESIGASPSECYDLLAEIAKLPETEASRFVRAACNVEAYYPKPVKGETNVHRTM